MITHHLKMESWWAYSRIYNNLNRKYYYQIALQTSTSVPMNSTQRVVTEKSKTLRKAH